MATKPTQPSTTDTAAKAAPEVLPLDGWKVQTGFGTLRTFDGKDLVRLEDVHTWLCDNGRPPKNAVRDVFYPFYMACLAHDEDGDSAALALPGALQLINATTDPNGVFKEGNLSKVQAVRFYASAFPALGHVRFADGSIGGLVYAMAEGALRVWHGHAHIGTDHLEMVKRRQERKADEACAIRWPDDEDLRKLLGRLAVPISTAYALWRWGKVSEVVRLHSVPTDGVDVDTKSAPVEWTGEKLAARQAVHKADGHKDFAKRTAQESGLHVREISRLIAAFKHGNAAPPSVATAWGSGTGKKTGAPKKN